MIDLSGVRVVITPFLPADEVRWMPWGEVHAGSMEAVEKMVDEENSRQDPK